ncbi:hypothetical protein DPMN_120503 [Dreissena polymorpha]|uniref:Uncharacterized protein n=1 Tax=Dreissena polymorpha TaxID=45954 RepID=A0A9D4GRP5_DREPO|nr:hypothetical protein DPMN_120503 [Dreissena polymorpha]
MTRKLFNSRLSKIHVPQVQTTALKTGIFNDIRRRQLITADALPTGTIVKIYGSRSSDCSEQPYDAMHRNRPTNQSHEYETLAAVTTPPPTQKPKSDHDYFILERK